MNDTTPLTQAELVQVLDLYIKPAYELVGGVFAVLTIGAAIFVVLGGVRILWRRAV